MRKFIFLGNAVISWEIIVLYVLCLLISLVIFYQIIKAAVKNGIIAARVHKDALGYINHNKQEPPANTKQEIIQQRYDKGEISFEEYKSEWNKLSS